MMGLGYLVAVFFCIAILVRVVHFANTPAHLRWELYPVPHEPPEKVEHGGSYLEDTDWWTKKHESDIPNEIKEMLEEILLLKALRTHNRKLWYVSFPFHSGIYLVAGFLVLLILGAVLSALGLVSAPEPGGLARLLFVHLPALLGFIGFAMGLAGALGLLFRRLTEPDLKDFTGPVDHGILVGFVLLFGLAFTCLLTDPTATGFRAYFLGLATATPAALPPLTYLVVLLGCIMLAYIPVSHMSHFVAKYFTYHSVRWNDEAMEPGGKLDKAIQKQLKLPVSWSASHIAGDGKKTWADVAGTNPTKESGK